jgi:hypothetical protein
MINKFIVTVVGGAAITVPLAGAASADPSANTNGVGAGGVPRALGEALNFPGPHIPGRDSVRVLARQPGSVPHAVAGAPTNPFPGQALGPGRIISGVTPAGPHPKA